MSINQVLGTYKATVKHNNDPRGIHRLILIIPQILGTAESEWAEASNPLGSIPVLGSIVWVHFSGGDITKPVYLSSGVVAPVVRTGHIGIDATAGGALSYGVTFTAAPVPIVCLAEDTATILSATGGTASGCTILFRNPATGAPIITGTHLVNWIVSGTLANP